MERHEQQLETLASISRLLAVRSGQRELLAAVLANSNGSLDVRRGTILLLTPNGRELVVAAAQSVESVRAAEERYQLGEGIVGRVVQTGDRPSSRAWPTSRGSGIGSIAARSTKRRMPRSCACRS